MGNNDAKPKTAVRTAARGRGPHRAATRSTQCVGEETSGRRASLRLKKSELRFLRQRASERFTRGPRHRPLAKAPPRAEADRTHDARWHECSLGRRDPRGSSARSARHRTSVRSVPRQLRAFCPVARRHPRCGPVAGPRRWLDLPPQTSLEPLEQVRPRFQFDGGASAGSP